MTFLWIIQQRLSKNQFVSEWKSIRRLFVDQMIRMFLYWLTSRLNGFFFLRIMWIKCFSSILFRKTSLRKRIQIWGFFWSVFSSIQSDRISLFNIQENTDQQKLRIWRLFTQYLFQWILLILIWFLFGLLISTLLFAGYIFLSLAGVDT